ncbi:MAG TPA: hypothetical protein H9927_02500 [Candidatus Alistipes merdipullorum]|nr:hypothetical protein [Candidatus Alistipes merdipullorum]
MNSNNRVTRPVTLPYEASHGIIRKHCRSHRAAACEEAALSAPRATLRIGTGSRISQLLATAEAVSSVVSSAEDLSSHSADKSCSTHTLP